MSAAKILQTLPKEVKVTLACANNIGVEPGRISNVKVESRAGHATRMLVKIMIPRGKRLEDWINDNLPREVTPEIESYIRGKFPKSKSA
jgi:hypothetical protein